MDLQTVGFLMMAHMAPTAKIVEEAKKMESYGAEIIYVTDSAGALLPHEVNYNNFIRSGKTPPRN